MQLTLNPDHKLLLVFLLICVCQVIRIIGDPVGFLGADSYFYLEAAENMAAGKGPIAVPMENDEITDYTKPVYLTVFPIGYSSCIAFVVWLTGISAFWASKIVNLISLAGCFLVLRKFNYSHAWLLGLVFGIFTLLEVFAYTWSEALFIFLQLLFGYFLYRLITANPVKFSPFWLGLTGILLFVVKYIGLYTVPFLALVSVWLYRQRRQTESKWHFVAAVSIGIAVLLYFYLNYYFSGYWWGGERMVSSGAGIGRFFWAIFRGLLNELNLLRHYYFKGPFDALFFVLYALQIVWLGLIFYLYIRPKYRLGLIDADALPKFFWLMAAAYLGALIGLRLLSPFDAFYYRLMAPASLFFYLGLVSYLTQPERLKLSPKLDLHLALFLLFCLLFQLPKAWLISLIR